MVDLFLKARGVGIEEQSLAFRVKRVVVDSILEFEYASEHKEYIRILLFGLGPFKSRLAACLPRPLKLTRAPSFEDAGRNNLLELKKLLLLTGELFAAFEELLVAFEELFKLKRLVKLSKKLP